MNDKLEVLIREFRQTDVDHLFFLHQRCHGPEHQLTYARLLDLLLHPDAVALVAETGDDKVSRIVGGLIVRAEPWQQRLAIDTLMVEQPLRRAGIGSRLVEWANRLAAGYDFERLVLRLAGPGTEAERFLAATGFAPEEENGSGEGEPPAGEGGAPGETLWTREVSVAAQP